MARRCFAFMAAAFALLPLRSQAAPVSRQGWSVVTGRTVGTRVDVLQVEAGWPGISATLLHGVASRVDLGGIFTFNYGFEGDVEVVRPGLKLQGVLRANLVDSGKFNLGLHFAPGPLVYFFRSTTLGGIAVPMGLVFGIRATNDLNVGLAFELPMFVVFRSSVLNGQLVLPVLFGTGLEYFFERNLALTFNFRIGPMIYTSDGFSDLDLRASVGLAFRF